MIMQHPRALETVFAGVRFRSRLEARWAVFFSEIDIPWEYEPESFALGRSAAYMPDFRIGDFRDGSVWFEVKAPGIPHDERWSELADQTGATIYVARGIPTLGAVALSWPDSRGITAVFGHDASDDGYEFCRCPWCFRIGIEYGGLGHRVCGQRCVQPDEDDIDICNSTNPLFLEAYERALSERFGI